MVRKTTYRCRYPRWLARLVTGLTSTFVIFVIPFNELTLWVSLGRCFISPRDFFDASWRHPSIISHDLLKLETLPPMPDCLHGIRAATYTQHFSWQFRWCRPTHTQIATKQQIVSSCTWSSSFVPLCPIHIPLNHHIPILVIGRTSYNQLTLQRQLPEFRQKDRTVISNREIAIFFCISLLLGLLLCIIYIYIKIIIIITFTGPPYWYCTFGAKTSGFPLSGPFSGQVDPGSKTARNEIEKMGGTWCPNGTT